MWGAHDKVPLSASPLEAQHLRGATVATDNFASLLNGNGKTSEDSGSPVEAARTLAPPAIPATRPELAGDLVSEPAPKAIPAAMPSTATAPTAIHRRPAKKDNKAVDWSKANMSDPVMQDLYRTTIWFRNIIDARSPQPATTDPAPPPATEVEPAIVPEHQIDLDAVPASPAAPSTTETEAKPAYCSERISQWLNGPREDLRQVARNHIAKCAKCQEHPSPEAKAPAAPSATVPAEIQRIQDMLESHPGYKPAKQPVSAKDLAASAMARFRARDEGPPPQPAHPIDPTHKLTALEQDAVDAIRQLGPGSSKDAVERTHRLLCRRLMPRDSPGRNYEKAYRGAINDVTTGFRTAADLERAFLQAVHPSAKHSGKVFAHNWNNGQAALVRSI